MNDNLITYAELARRLNKSKPYISKIKYRLVDCLVEVKIKNKTKTLIDYDKAKQILTKDSKDKNVRQTLNKQAKQEIQEERTQKEIQEAKQEEIQEEIQEVKEAKQEIQEVKQAKQETQEVKKQTKKEIIQEVKEEIKTKDIEDLQTQIKQKIESEYTTFTELQNLKIKSEILKTYAVSQSEELKYQQLKNNLFDKSEILKIYSYVLNNIRNSLLNLSNNYAVSLEGLNKKQIKEYVDLDINKILEELYSLKNKF
jgi:flagellar biosynthesis GTPase FlhF